MQPKLVRDNIPDIINANGEEPILRFLDNSEILPALGEKLVEEGWEVFDSQTPEQTKAELVDYKEVLDSFCNHAGYDKSLISAALEKLRIEQKSTEIRGDLKFSMLQQNAINSAIDFNVELSEDAFPLELFLRAYWDMQELSEFIGVSPEDLEQDQIAKRQKVGGFALGIVLVSVEE